ncbi:hypothetical protein BJ980_003103 [Nocardioides daedukensis]|uniref:Uncharacterized protein n=1 Tax=Nocardioides daedukensis TaxID=634462 RepID=A0A7Y9UW22_9ACTN|nr:hypothetical protein [Nocardioides daedukensis]NYG60180.1 hypothetical protein [Nocardioides daedukensis]
MNTGTEDRELRSALNELDWSMDAPADLLAAVEHGAQRRRARRRAGWSAAALTALIAAAAPLALSMAEDGHEPGPAGGSTATPAPDPTKPTAFEEGERDPADEARVRVQGKVGPYCERTRSEICAGVERGPGGKGFIVYRVDTGAGTDDFDAHIRELAGSVPIEFRTAKHSRAELTAAMAKVSADAEQLRRAGEVNIAVLTVSNRGAGLFVVQRNPDTESVDALLSERYSVPFTVEHRDAPSVTLAPQWGVGSR